MQFVRSYLNKGKNIHNFLKFVFTQAVSHPYILFLHQSHKIELTNSLNPYKTGSLASLSAFHLSQSFKHTSATIRIHACLTSLESSL